MPSDRNIAMDRLEPGPGQERKSVAVVGTEDAEEALARVQDWTVSNYSWATRIVRGPVRVGQRWFFIVRGA